jgi:DNA (cytosine-5)-methyltransferase 1
MNHLGLFEGIGGFSLAARWMGWKTVAWCEWNEFGQKVLRHHFPEAEGHGDITKTDFTKYANTIDILTGGFPCQPYSSAGKRLGKEDDRHLWPEMLRVIREVQPTWVVGENVFGLVNWSGGLVFDEVQSDLEAQGYEVQPYVLPAVSVNAPHRRDRVWFVAYRNNNGLNKRNSQNEINTSKGRLDAFCDTCKSFNNGNASNTNSSRWRQSPMQGKLWSDFISKSSFNCRISDKAKNAEGSKRFGWEQDAKYSNSFGQKGRLHQDKSEASTGQQFSTSNAWNVRKARWENFPTQSPLCNGDDGLSNRLDSITFSKWRNESIKAGGNAIVPQVAYQIFKSIEEYEKRL